MCHMRNPDCVTVKRHLLKLVWLAKLSAISPPSVTKIISRLLAENIRSLTSSRITSSIGMAICGADLWQQHQRWMDGLMYFGPLNQMRRASKGVSFLMSRRWTFDYHRRSIPGLRNCLNLYIVPNTHTIKLTNRLFSNLIDYQLFNYYTRMR